MLSFYFFLYQENLSRCKEDRAAKDTGIDAYTSDLRKSFFEMKVTNHLKLLSLMV